MLRRNIFHLLITNLILIFIFLVRLSCVHASLIDTANLDTLELVQILFRQGDRAPENAYPTDPYQDESLWPDGWGQLTDQGKMQEYELGVYLRNRYDTFISDKYVPDEIYVLSSDLDRAIMSAELCLAGMFPTNKNDTNWNSEINWQPVPLHTIEVARDNMIYMKKPCPKYDDLLNDFLYNSDMMKKINSDNAELFKDLSRKSGTNITSVVDLSFFNAVVVEKYYNFTLPDWTETLFIDENFQTLYNFSFAAKSHTPELQRLRAGELVKYLSNNINKSISNSEDVKTKFFMLSGHDSTLVALMNAFGVFNMKLPYYATVLMMELHKDVNSTDNYYFNIFLRNDTSQEAYKLKIPGCDFDCPLETFFQKVSPIIPQNWDEECQTSKKSSHFPWIATFAIGAASAVLLGLVIMSSLTMYRRIRQNKQMRRGYRQY